MPRTDEQEQVETYEAEKPDTELARELKKYSKRSFSSLLDQIETEFTLSYWFMRPKWEEWSLRLKLYNNQRRDKSAVGDPLMFTIHQTVLASLYSDRLMVEFTHREEGDEETMEVLNAAAEYDEDEMGKDITDYEWDWDASFFWRGLCLFNDFERGKVMTPIPEIIDPMTFFRDPRAKSVNGDRRGRGAMRFGGREIRLTKREMRDSGVYFNFEDLKQEGTDINDTLDRYSQLRAEAQGLGDVSRYSLKGENADYRILEWLTFHRGRMVIVGVAGRNRKRVVRYTPLEGERWPIIDRTIYPIAHDWDGVSIPDLSEDKQRGRAVVSNLGLAYVKAGLNPRFMFNTNKIKNKADLNIEFAKHVPVDGTPTNEIVPIQTPAIKAEAGWIMEVLDTAAQRATATPEIQQGQVSGKERTATELNLVATKVDTRYSLSAKIFGWSEKRFWRRWYELYDRHFNSGIDEKVIRIVGALGPIVRKVQREGVVGAASPDIDVESRVVSEARKTDQLTKLRLIVKDAIATGQQVNTRYALKKMAKLAGLRKAVIDQLFMPTTDELMAEDENRQLEKGVKVMVEPTDDDMAHMEVQNRASDTNEKAAHINAHKRNMALKKEKPELFPQLATPQGQQGAAELMEKVSVQRTEPRRIPTFG